MKKLALALLAATALLAGCSTGDGSATGDSRVSDNISVVEVNTGDGQTTTCVVYARRSGAIDCDWSTS